VQFNPSLFFKFFAPNTNGCAPALISKYNSRAYRNQVAVAAEKLEIQYLLESVDLQPDTMIFNNAGLKQ
jgi:hypothetical protein